MHKLETPRFEYRGEVRDELPMAVAALVTVARTVGVNLLQTKNVSQGIPINFQRKKFKCNRIKVVFINHKLIIK